MDYSDVIRFYSDPNNDYTKDELYEAYLDRTVRFLEELISANTYEERIIASLGEEAASELIEKIAAETVTITEPVTDRAERIEALLRYCKDKFG